MVRTLLAAAFAALSLAMASAGPVNAADQATILLMHTQTRASVSPPAANMGVMVWDDALATSASTYADTCASGHSGIAGIGENLSWGWVDNSPPPAMTATAAVKAWIDEQPNYLYTNASCSASKVCGHYTQMVWATSTKIGCGMKTCTNGLMGHTTTDFWVCHYGPAGNVAGQQAYIAAAVPVTTAPIATPVDASAGAIATAPGAAAVGAAGAAATAAPGAAATGNAPNGAAAGGNVATTAPGAAATGAAANGAAVNGAAVNGATATGAATTGAAVKRDAAVIGSPTAGGVTGKAGTNVLPRGRTISIGANGVPIAGNGPAVAGSDSAVTSDSATPGRVGGAIIRSAAPIQINGDATSLAETVMTNSNGTLSTSGVRTSTTVLRDASGMIISGPVADHDIRGNVTIMGFRSQI